MIIIAEVAEVTQWWRAEGDDVYIYTEKIKEARKNPFHSKCLMGSYYKKGLFAHQYKVNINSPEWSEFKNKLSLNNKNRFKEERK